VSLNEDIKASLSEKLDKEVYERLHVHKKKKFIANPKKMPTLDQICPGTPRIND